MTRRSTWILSSIAALLLALVLFDRGRVSTGERAARRGRLLEGLVRDRLERIELESADGGRIVIDARRDEEGELPTWELLEPVRETADQEAVSELVSEIDWAEPARRLGGVSPEDLDRFGLREPRVRLRLQVGAETIVLRVGADDPTGAGAYAQVEGRAEVAIVRHQLLEALSRPPTRYRAKEVLPDLPIEEVVRLRLESEEPVRVIARKGRRWWIREPVEAMADRLKVSEMLRALRDLRAERFSSGVSEQEAGLDAPWLLVRVGLGEQERVLRVGGPCGEHAGERYASGSRKVIVCVRESSLAPLRSSLESLRDARLLDAEPIDVAAVGLEGPKGEVRLSLTRVEEGEDGSPQWRLQSSEFQGEVSEDYVQRFFARLSSARAERFEPADEGSLRRRGLDPPAMRLRVRFLPEVDREPETLLLGQAIRETEGIETWVQRQGEPWLLRVSGDLSESLVPPLQLAGEPSGEPLWRLDASRIARIELRGPTDSARAWVIVRLEDGSWHYSRAGGDPGSGEPVSEEVLSPLLDALTLPRVERSLPEGEEGRAGSTEPELRVKVLVTPPEGSGAGLLAYEMELAESASEGNGRLARVRSSEEGTWRHVVLEAKPARALLDAAKRLRSWGP